MTVSERVKKLRRQSLDAEETLSGERAELITKFYKQNTGLVSTPVRRALAFQYLMEHKTIYIGEGELIVGEKGPTPKATPTYPELCCHSLQDLDILNSREKIPFAVSPQVRQVYEKQIIPFWQDKSMRELLFAEMTDEWRAAYEAGIFTEFMEQRAPGHTVLDDKIYRKGMLDFEADIQHSLQELDYLHDPLAYAKEQELQAMSICAEALIRFAQRHADLARVLAKRETDPQRKAELERIAEVCAHVPAHAPRDFWEALQYYWFVHLGVTTELNTWDTFCPGHLDRHLHPFYQKGLAGDCHFGSDSHLLTVGGPNVPQISLCARVNLAGGPRCLRARPREGNSCCECDTTPLSLADGNDYPPRMGGREVARRRPRPKRRTVYPAPGCLCRFTGKRRRAD